MITLGPLWIDAVAAVLRPAQYWKAAVVDGLSGGQVLQLTIGVPEPATLALLLTLLPVGLSVRLAAKRHPAASTPECACYLGRKEESDVA